MKILSRRDVHIAAENGDTLNLWDGDQLLLTQPITKQIKIDVVMAVEIEKGELGLKTGIAGVFGEKLKDSTDGGQP